MKKYAYRTQEHGQENRFEADDYSADTRGGTLTFWKGKKGTGEKLKTVSIYRGWEIRVIRENA